ncbi:gelsolin repeat domain-containing protein [Phthorimaea operculella]|nr:gelsolin repeat domain-containing protein [Phthorimaea operculella]
MYETEETLATHLEVSSGRPEPEQKESALILKVRYCSLIYTGFKSDPIVYQQLEVSSGRPEPEQKDSALILKVRYCSLIYTGFKSDPTVYQQLEVSSGRQEPEQKDSALILKGMQEQANTQHNERLERNSFKSDPIVYQQLEVSSGRPEPEQKDSALILKVMQEQVNTQHNERLERNSELNINMILTVVKYGIFKRPYCSSRIISPRSLLSYDTSSLFLPWSYPIARKLRLRRGRPEPEQKDSALILKGMQEQANTQHNERLERNSELKPKRWDESLEKPPLDYSEFFDEDTGQTPGLTVWEIENFIPAPVDEVRSKRWDESLEKPPLDYSEFFDEDTGQTPGLTVWEIENFIPAPVDEVAFGKFFEGDCYIVLKTSVEEQGQLSWDIHFWIGSKATLDKGACAAMHAVNLRNLLGAKRTQRHEQGDETDEFIALFPTPPVYLQGSHTPSGFYTVDEPHYETRLYRVHAAGNGIHLEPVAVDYESLDPRYVFVLDTGLTIYLWNGKKAKNTLKSKARLFAEKINKEERKNKAELIAEPPGKEPRAFWDLLGYEGDNPYVPKEHVPADFTWPPPRLYRVELGMGYLELPQPEPSPLARTVLNTRNVYILDARADVFVWFGKKSSRLVRAAAVKLAQELFNMVARPPHSLVTRLQEGTETQVFKTYFLGWEEVIAVDFTRTAESVARTGADLASWAKNQETKADLSALFTPRQPAMQASEAKTLLDEWNEDLEAMEAFVLEGRHFVRLPDAELGVFYTQDCYVFLCRYLLPAEPEDEHSDSPEADDDGETASWVVYFWQGRKAPNMGWLTFTFGLERKFKQLCKRLDVVRTHQQQGRKAPNMGWLTFTFGLERKFKQLCKRLDVVRTHQQQASWVVYFWQGRKAPNMGWLTFTFGLERKFKQLCKRLDVVRTHQQQGRKAPNMGWLTFTFGLERKFKQLCKRLDVVRTHQQQGRKAPNMGWLTFTFGLERKFKQLCKRLDVVRTHQQQASDTVSFLVAGEPASWVVYFWQGRKAPNMGWLTFTFGLERKFKQLCKRLDVVRTHQQQGRKAPNMGWLTFTFGLERKFKQLCKRLDVVRTHQQQMNPDVRVQPASWVVYFWQGRKAPNMGWLTFTFGLERKFKQLCKRLDVVRTHQQQGRKAPNMGWLTFTFGLERKFKQLCKRLDVVRTHQQQRGDQRQPQNQACVNGVFLQRCKQRFRNLAAVECKRDACRPSWRTGEPDRRLLAAAEMWSQSQTYVLGGKARLTSVSLERFNHRPSQSAGLQEEIPGRKAGVTVCLQHFDIDLASWEESLKFMAHFHRRFIIKDGKRNAKPEGRPPVELYELRSNGSALCTRLIQVKADASQLNSAFCYILNVPLEGSNEESSAIVYAWIGSKADADCARLIEQIAEEKFNNPWVSLQVLTEGSEPDNFFWVALGGRKPYDTDADFLHYTRLFRCSNEKGYFTVSEKCTDFCQDDLADDDIMILDNGTQVFLWLGAKCSEVEIKLAYKSAQVYIQHMKTMQPERPRKLFLTLKDKESKRFTRCFHGWGEHKRPPE